MANVIMNMNIARNILGICGKSTSDASQNKNLTIEYSYEYI